MSDISRGPVSSMPYSRHALPEGTMCDQHPKRKAVARVQGETDSFGCEYNDVCRQCLKEIRKHQNSAEARAGVCDWCGKHATDLRDARDYDEGMGGACIACAVLASNVETMRLLRNWRGTTTNMTTGATLDA